MNGTQDGIRCPQCGSVDHQMTDSHSVAYFRRRHYICRRCGRGFATREVPEAGVTAASSQPEVAHPPPVQRTKNHFPREIRVGVYR